jgi:hypothetical protein
MICAGSARVDYRKRAGSMGATGRLAVEIRLAGCLDITSLLRGNNEPLRRLKEGRHVRQPECSVGKVSCQRKSSH